MVNLAEVQKQADELTLEERNGLLAYLLDKIPDFPASADEEELDRREAEMDSGAVTPVAHDEFLAQVGRKR
ncbi:addiction module protein [Haloferula sargassicola]|uniref:Addiction module component n=1 Tax=Haloferula sargassicola TaxID=490096 RepID=A0ABP9UPI4_9BACT